MNADRSTRTVVARITEHIHNADDSWRGFGGAYKCIVWDAETSGLTNGQDLNIVAATEAMKLKGGFLYGRAAT